jgi:hypothetical protein
MLECWCGRSVNDIDLVGKVSKLDAGYIYILYFGSRVLLLLSLVKGVKCSNV